MNVGDVTAELDRWFPRRIAESWDNVGLLLGDPNETCLRVMTCLTVTPSTAREAITAQANLIVSHHPILFRPVGRLTSTGEHGFVYELARAGVAVYSPHTAFDGADGGINDQIAERLELRDVRPIRPTSTPEQYKLAVFIPEGDLPRVSSAMFQAGAGVIGEYEECSFRVAGTGSFRGSLQSNPSLGEPGQREQVKEFRLEVVVPPAKLRDVLHAMKEAHSYEEPGFDLYPLVAPEEAIGAGRLGKLGSPMSVLELARKVKQVLGSRHVEYVGNPNSTCQTVGIGCGSATDLMRPAAELGCDLFITGEARFHDQLAAEGKTHLILAGHYATERFALETLAERMSAQWPGIDCWASRDERDPACTV